MNDMIHRLEFETLKPHEKKYQKCSVLLDLHIWKTENWASDEQDLKFYYLNLKAFDKRFFDWVCFIKKNALSENFWLSSSLRKTF